MHYLTPMIAGGALLISVSLSAEPFIPARDGEILADVAASGSQSQAIHTLRTALNRDPHDAATAHALSRLYLREARYSGDARYVAYAQAALAPWWTGSTLGPDARMARAEVKAALHDFESAIDELDQVIAVNPQQVDAHLLRATLLQLRGEPQRANLDCVHLAQGLDPLTGIACLAAGAHTDAAIRRALAVLQGAQPQIQARESDYRQWFHAVMAELAARLGDWTRAQRYLDAAAADGPLDIATRALQADVLLQQERYAQVLKAIPETTPADALLARKLVALRALRHADFPAAQSLAQLRLRESELRATPGHARDLALLALSLNDDARAYNITTRQLLNTQEGVL